VQAVYVVDNCEERSSTASSSPPSAAETRSSTPDRPDVTLTLQSADLAHHKPTFIQPAITTSDVRRQTSRRDVDHEGRQEHLAVEQGTFVPLAASTEASEPSRRHSPVWVKLDDQGPSTGAVAGDEDGFVGVEDLNVVDAGQTSVDDCLVTSLRAEVSLSPSIVIIIIIIIILSFSHQQNLLDARLSICYTIIFRFIVRSLESLLQTNNYSVV